jgi:hypothetical protein
MTGLYTRTCECPGRMLTDKEKLTRHHQVQTPKTIRRLLRLPTRLCSHCIIAVEQLPVAEKLLQEPSTRELHISTLDTRRMTQAITFAARS